MTRQQRWLLMQEPSITYRDDRKIISDPANGIGLSIEVKPYRGIQFQILCLALRGHPGTMSSPLVFEHSMS